jgi:hypothetical protein
MLRYLSWVLTNSHIFVYLCSFILHDLTTAEYSALTYLLNVMVSLVLIDIMYDLLCFFALFLIDNLYVVCYLFFVY